MSYEKAQGISYEKAKRQFEAMVKWMQKDLLADSQKPGANQKYIETRTSMINTMVEFNNATELLISQLEMSLLAAEEMYTDKLVLSRKLAMLCKIHLIDPNMVFFYLHRDLDEAFQSGFRVCPNGKTVLDIKGPEDLDYTKDPDEPIDLKTFKKNLPQIIARENYSKQYFEALFRCTYQPVPINL